jgi:hypothetical protein
MSRSHIRLAAASAAACMLAAGGALATGGPAVAATAGARIVVSSGETGEPQPELDTFTVAPAGASGGSGAVLPGGSMVLAWIANNGKDALVCVLPAGARKCSSTATLKPFGGDQFFGTAEVFADGGASVTVALSDCCAIGPDGILVYNSTDGGLTFSAFAKAGNLPGIATGVRIGGQLVLSPDLNPAGLQIQAVVAHPKAPQTAIANPSPQDADTSLTSYKSGVVAACDTLGKTYTTVVRYAASGSSFNATGSYHKAGSFGGEQLAWASGTALLTMPGTGGARLRFFTGTGFGAAHAVPEPPTPDDAQFTVQQTGSVSHVFFVAARSGYDVMTETTSDGVHWSALHTLHTFITQDASEPVLGPSGSGILLGTSPGAGEPALAQPVLNPQHVTLKLAKTHVPAGQSTQALGQASPVLPGQVVTLQKESSGKWFDVTTTKESSKGTFAFTVPGVTRTYRAVVAYKPGYYLYGYSNTVKLTAG